MSLRILYVESDARATQAFKPFFQWLEELTDINLLQVASQEEALATLVSVGGEVVLVGTTLNDANPLDFAREVAKKMPLVDAAVVSTLSADDFHEATEGLGVFKQLPPEPKEEDAREFIAKLQKIRQLLSLKGGLGS